jgi:NAD(P)-dependent dehydrogenase (short-subunit alcohol dehydrogenase family)
MAAIPEQASKPSGDWSRLLLNKVVFVTGGDEGIGSTIAETCVLHGARVVVADVNKNAADEVATKIIDEDTSKKAVSAIPTGLKCETRYNCCC